MKIRAEARNTNQERMPPTCARWDCESRRPRRLRERAVTRHVPRLQPIPACSRQLDRPGEALASELGGVRERQTLSHDPRAVAPDHFRVAQWEGPFQVRRRLAVLDVERVNQHLAGGYEEVAGSQDAQHLGPVVITGEL